MIYLFTSNMTKKVVFSLKNQLRTKELLENQMKTPWNPIWRIFLSINDFLSVRFQVDSDINTYFTEQSFNPRLPKGSPNMGFRVSR